MQRYRSRLEREPEDAFALQRLEALYLQRDGSLEGWLGTLRAWVEREPRQFAPRFLLARTLHQMSKLEQAEVAYREASALAPARAAPRLAHAELLLQLGARARAAEVARQALAVARGPERPRALRMLGELALDAGDLERARPHYARLAKLGGGGVFAAAELARALASRGQHAAAAAEYLALAARMRDDRRALGPLLRGAARAQLDAGEPAQALETLTRALRLARASEQRGRRAELYDLLIEAHRALDSLPSLAAQLAAGGTRDFERMARLARLYDELGEEDKAVAAYRRALALSPRHLDTRLRFAQLLSRSGRLEAVVEQYRTLVRLSPDEPRFLVELADLLVQTGRGAEARALAAREGRRRPRAVALHRALGELYTRWQEPELAARELELLVRIDPRDPAHRIALGSHRLERGDRDGAMAVWRGLLQGPDKAAAHAELAGVLADHDLLREALTHLEAALKLAPGELSYQRAYASLLERLGRAPEAERAWRAVMSTEGGDSESVQEARQHVVSIWKRTGLLGRRIRTLERRFAANPTDRALGRTLAEAYGRAGGREREAIAVLERLAAQAPGDVGTLRALERAYGRAERPADALRILRQLVEADPLRAQGYLRRAVELALSQYRDEEALELAERAVQLSPNDAQAQRLLGDLYRGRQELDKASAAYTRALELDPRQFDTALTLSELELARGQVAVADKVLRGIMRGCPDDELVGRATRAALQLHLGADSLPALERELLPLALGRPRRPVYRRLVVELYGVWLGPIVQRIRAGIAADEERQRLRTIGRRAIKPLLEALADADPVQRSIALDVLGHLDNGNAAAPLLSLVATGTDASERARALLAAGALGDARLAPRFEQIARGSERRLRAIATWALARAGGASATAALRALLEDGDAAVRAFAALGLGAQRVDAAEPALVALAARERHRSVRSAALWALGQIAPDAHRARLIEALDAPAPIAQLALHALRHDRAAVARGLFATEASLRAQAARMLARPTASGPGPLPVPDWPLSLRDYLRGLARGGDRDDAPPLDLGPWVEPIALAAEAALGGSSERARTALDVLLSDPAGVGLPVLSSRLSTWPRAQCFAAVDALESLGRRLGPALMRLADSADPALRDRAVVLLVRAGFADVPAVRRALAGPEGALQRAVLDGLAARRGGAPAAARPLLLGLAGGRKLPWVTRLRAVRALGAARAEPRELGVLAQVLREDPYALVRQAAAEALASASDPSARRALELALDDPEPVVSGRARALARDGAPSRSAAARCAQATN